MEILTGQFKTIVDIRLRQWVEQQLPLKSVEAGWEVLQEEFRQFLKKAKSSKDHDVLFDNLKQAVVDEALTRHTWEDKVNASQCSLLEIFGDINIVFKFK